jgi:hypothetical protein
LSSVVRCWVDAVDAFAAFNVVACGFGASALAIVDGFMAVWHPTKIISAAIAAIRRQRA